MKKPMKPKFTQIPNYFLDVLMSGLKESELRCLLVIARKTYGFHKDIDKIANSQFEELTGMSRNGVRNGLEGLLKKELIIQHEKGSSDKGCSIKISSYEVNLDYKISSEGVTSLHDRVTSLQKESERGSPNTPTKENNINKSTKENKIDATHLENNNFNIYTETIKVFHVGYKAIAGKEWNWSKKKAQKNGQLVKDLIEIATYDYRKIENKKEREEKAFHEICRRAKILFRLIKARDKFYGKIEFLPGKLGYFWDDLVVDKRQLTKKELSENSMSNSVASVTKFLKNK